MLNTVLMVQVSTSCRQGRQWNQWVGRTAPGTQQAGHACPVHDAASGLSLLGGQSCSNARSAQSGGLSCSPSGHHQAA